MEEWRDVAGYDGFYKVSNHGAVQSCKCLRKLRIQNSGYKIVDLKNGGIKHTRTVHRLVAQTFIPNPENLPEIDHIDGNKLNNQVSNLRWVSKSDNHLNPNTPKPFGVTGHRNVYYHIKNGLYQVSIKRNGRHVYQRAFKTLLEAIKARDEFLSGK